MAESEKKSESAKSKPQLLRAAESSDAGVHKLLADRQALTMNPEANENAKERIKAIDDELESLGYSAS